MVNSTDRNELREHLLRGIIAKALQTKDVPKEVMIPKANMDVEVDLRCTFTI